MREAREREKCSALSHTHASPGVTLSLQLCAVKREKRGKAHETLVHLQLKISIPMALSEERARACSKRERTIEGVTRRAPTADSGP